MKGLETAFYASIGLALKGKDKAEKWAKRIAKDSRMEASAGKKFVDGVVRQAESAKKEFSKRVDETVKATANKMGYVTRKEADMLKEEIAKLKALLKKSDAKVSKSKSADKRTKK